MRRREFIESAFKIGGLAALYSLGLSSREISCCAQDFGAELASASGGAADPCGGYLLCENFETPTTGYDNPQGLTWTAVPANGIINPAYVTGPLRGSQSLRIYAADYHDGTDTVSFTGGSPRYSAFRLKLITYPTDYTNLVYLMDASGNVLTKLETNNAGRIRMVHGSVVVDPGITLSTSTLYYVWIEYTKGTGSNGTLNGYYSTTTTKPGSPTWSITTGTSTADAAKLQFHIANGPAEYLIDQIIVDSSSIGSMSN
jgi:hypothetical protein